MNRRFGQPRLPRGILHTLTEIRAPAPTYDCLLYTSDAADEL